MKLVIQYFRQAVAAFPRRFLCASLFILLLTGLDTCLPWALRYYIDTVIEENRYGVLLLGILLFAIFLLIRIFVNTQWYVSLDRFGGAYIEKLSTQMEASLSGCYYDEIQRIQPPIIRNILYSDILNVFRMLGHHIPALLGAGFVIAACILVSCLYSPQVSLFVLCAAVIGVSISWCSRKILSKVAGQTNQKLKIHDSWCGQFVDMLPLVHSHNILAYFQGKTRENLQDFVQTAVSEDRKTVFWSGLTSGYHSLFSIVLSALLALPLAEHSVSSLIFFTMISDIVMEQAQKIESLFQQTMKLLPSLRHVDALLNLPQRPGDAPLESIQEITFSSVDFTYPNGVRAAEGISCHLCAGDFVRLCGENGSGKSTFIKLLTGMYRNTGGQILLNGVPLAQFSKEALNRQILYINQDEPLLNEPFQSYLETVTGLEIPDGTFSQLLRHVNLPDLDVPISGNGQSLSVGQRKKLLAAKFLLASRDASVIILDELTAGMDETTAAAVYADVLSLSRETRKIILVVEHKAPSGLSFTKTLRFANGTLT